MRHPDRVVIKPILPRGERLLQNLYRVENIAEQFPAKEGALPNVNNGNTSHMKGSVFVYCSFQLFCFQGNEYEAQPIGD